MQETAYSILALDALDGAGYSADIYGARSFLQGVQLGTGGWESYPGDGENSQITGEALWAIPEPATVILIGLGGLSFLRKRRP